MNGIRRVEGGGRSFETDPGGRINESEETPEVSAAEEVSESQKPRPTQDRFDKSGATQDTVPPNPYPGYTKKGEMESSVVDGEDNDKEEEEENPEDEE